MEKWKENAQKVLDEGVSTGYLPCGIVLCHHKGEDTFLSAGYQDMEAKKPIARDSIFRLFSMTKPVTAVAAMILIERGQLGIYDEVSWYLPAFSNFTAFVDGQKEVMNTKQNALRIRHLLTMESGLGYGGPDNESDRQVKAVIDKLIEHADTGDGMTTIEAANAFGSCVAQFKPGTRWRYGVSADILGAVIEVITGKTLGEFMKEEIFDPLGMTDTGFYVPDEKKNRLAKRYEETEDGTLKESTLCALGVPYYFTKKTRFESGGAGLTSTCDDYMKFAKMLLGKGEYNGHRILSERSVRFLHEDAMTPALLTDFEHQFGSHMGYHYAHLFQVMAEPGRANELSFRDQFGWDGWTGGQLCVCPHDDTILLIFGQKNSSAGNRYAFRIKNTIFSQLKENK